MSAGVAVVLLFAVAALCVLVAMLARSYSAGHRLDRLLADTAAARQASEAVDRRFDELRRSVDDRVGSVERRVAEGQKSLTDHLGESGRLLQDVGEKMGRIFEASVKIEKLATDVTRLEDLLKPPKLRGTLGETFLEQALRQALPPKCWTMQYRFPDGVQVDAAIFVGDRLVPVDSKFPLENYRRSRDAADETERRRAQRDFASDVRRHVDAIRARYVRPDSGTYDFALMYVPAESVYCEIAGVGEESALADYALERRVVPVSPRLLYAYLATVAMGLKGLELQQSALDVQAKLADLSRRWEKVEIPFSKLGTHLLNTQKQYDETNRAIGGFSSRLTGIAESVEPEPETESSPAPRLVVPPPA